MQNIQRPTSYTKSRTKTFDLVITAILAALVFVATMFINLKLPIGQGGLIHLGTSMLFISAILFGPKRSTCWSYWNGLIRYRRWLVNLGTHNHYFTRITRLHCW